MYKIPNIKSEYYDKDEIAEIIESSKKSNIKTLETIDSDNILLIGYQRKANKKKRRCINVNYVKNYKKKFNKIFQLLYRLKDENGGEHISGYATGFFIDKRVIITVAHEMFHKKNNGDLKLYDSVIISPFVQSKNKKCVYPLGGAVSYTFCPAQEYSRNRNKDYGAVFLKDDDLYNKIKSAFKVKNVINGNYSISTAGYYALSSCVNIKKFHLLYGKTTAKVFDDYIEHNINSKRGQSGMPIFLENDNMTTVIGINDTDCNLKKVKINKNVIIDFNEWIKIANQK